jgi:hypothetical protein
MRLFRAAYYMTIVFMATPQQFGLSLLQTNLNEQRKSPRF